jgi:Domain of unknown function (DUF4258)
MADGASLLAEIHRAARYGQIMPSRHARERMEERNVSAEELWNAIKGATAASPEPGTDKIRLEGGTDADGDEVKVIVALHPRGLRVITVM